MKSKGILFLAVTVILVTLVMTGIYAISLPSPIVNLLEPQNKALLSDNSVTIQCSAQTNVDGQSLKNITLYDDFGGSWTSDETQNVSGQGPVKVTFIRDVTDGSYKWNCLACATIPLLGTQCSFADADYTFTVDTTPPETSIVYFTHNDYVTDPHYCDVEYDGLTTTWIGYNSNVVTHGVSEDESGIKVDTFSPAHVWDQVFITWYQVNPESPNGAETVPWNTLNFLWTVSLTPNDRHRVCGRAMDIAGNQELPGQGQINVWGLSERQDYNGECCDVCVDMGGLNPTITKTIGQPSVTKDDLVYLTNHTPINLSCTNIHEDIPCSPPTYLRYKIDDGSWTTVNGQGEIELETGDFYIDNSYADGLHTISYECGTEAGGVTTGSETDFLDNTGPTVHKDIGMPKYPENCGEDGPMCYVTNHTNFTFSCNDGNGVDSGTVTVNGGTNDWPYVTTFDLPNGQFNINYYCTDALGNEGSEKTETDYMDNQQPVIDITEPNQYENQFGCGSNMFTVMATITNGGVGVKGANATLGSRTIQLTYNPVLNSWTGDMNHWGLMAGNYDLVITAWDYLGNTNIESYPITLNYDVNFQDPTGTRSCCPKGSTCTYDFNVTMCHGGNATAMMMSKVCGTGYWYPALWYSNNAAQVTQVPWLQFLNYLSNGFPESPWNFLSLNSNDLGINAIVHLNISVPTGWQGGASDDCKILKFKWVAGNDNSPVRLSPNNNAPFPYNLDGLGEFDLNDKGNCVEFNIAERQCAPNRPSNTCGTDNCGNSYNNCNSGYVCQDNQCVQSQTHHGGGGGGGSSLVATSTCNPNWVCGSWNVCTSGIQIRNCADSNNCGTLEGMPAESQACDEAQASSSSTSNENAGSSTPLTGAAVGTPSALIGGVLFVLIVALAVVATIVVRKLTVKGKN